MTDKPVFLTESGMKIYNILRGENTEVIETSREIMRTLVRIDDIKKLDELEGIAALVLTLAVAIEEVSGGDSKKLCVDLFYTTLYISEVLTALS